MTTFRVNTPYLQHSTPEYNAAHKKENSEYNAKYYQAHKDKWGVKKDSDSKSGTDEDDKDEKDKKKKKSGETIEDVLSKLNGGSKSVGKGSSGKKSSSKTEKASSEKKKKDETEEEKTEREKKEKEEAERQAEEQRKKNVEYNDNLKKMWNDYNKILEERKKKKTVKHSFAVNLDGELYLKHHGIDNQRWGVRHGPPYPLAKGVSNAIIRGVADTVKQGAKKGLKEGRKNAINYAVQGTVRPVSDRLQKKNNPQKFDAKKLATGALVIAGSALATGIITKLVDVGIDKAVEGGKKAVANVLMNAPHEGLSNVGVNMLLDAARKAKG